MLIFNSLIFLIKDFNIKLLSMMHAGAAGISKSEKIQKIQPELEEFAS